VRYARQQILSGALAEPYYGSRADGGEELKGIRHLLMPAPVDIPLPASVKAHATATPEGSSKFATILSEETKRLLAMDGYERRALSPRKFAIRAFDEARRLTIVLLNNSTYTRMEQYAFGGTKPKLSIISNSR